jgi:alcohol dehydrogenase class IV
VAGTPHAETNATMLPHTLAAMLDRAPEAMAALAGALATDPEELPARVSELGGGERRLSALLDDRGRLEAVADAAGQRAELAMTPRPPDRAELLSILNAAW